MTDPYAPPQAPWNPYPPYGYGPPPPPPRNTKTIVVVASIAVAAFLLLPVFVFFAGGVVRHEIRSTSRTIPRERLDPQSRTIRVSTDPRGPGFGVDVLAGWAPVPPIPGRGARLTLRTPYGGMVEVTSQPVTVDEAPSVALRKAFEETALGEPTGAITTWTAGGTPALVQQVERQGTVQWIAALSHRQTRFVVSYAIPASTGTEQPDELLALLDTWSW